MHACMQVSGLCKPSNWEMGILFLFTTIDVLEFSEFAHKAPTLYEYHIFQHVGMVIS